MSKIAREFNKLLNAVGGVQANDAFADMCAEIGEHLYEIDPAFRESIDKVAEAFTKTNRLEDATP